MSSVPPADLERSSEFSTWMVLICSGVALVMFFGWFVKDMVLRVSPDNTRGSDIQSSLDVGSVSETLESSATTVELADSQPVKQETSSSNLSLESDKQNAKLNDSAATKPIDTRENTTQWIQSFATKKADETVKGEQLRTLQSRLFAKQQNATRATAMQEPVVTDDHPSTEESGPVEMSTGHSKDAILTPNSTVQTTKAKQTPESSLDTTPSQANRQTADFGALSQLLAEAAAINEKGAGRVKAERERREKLESLSSLSAAIQFAPGSKVASESVISTLKQIQPILADYPETRINVIVTTNESNSDKQNIRLSQERGRTLIAKLVKNGVAFSRFSLKALADEKMPANSHRVEIETHTK